MNNKEEYEPFNGVRRNGPKEVRLYRSALMGEYDYRKARDETVMERVQRLKKEEENAKKGLKFKLQSQSHMCKVMPNDVSDYINRQNITAKPIERLKKPDPSKATLPASKEQSILQATIAQKKYETEEAKLAPIGSPEQMRNQTMRPSTTQSNNARVGYDSMTSLTSFDGKEEQDRLPPPGKYIEPVTTKKNPDVSKRDPFYMTRDGGQKQARLYRTALMGEYNRFPDKRKLFKDEVDEWVKRSQAELARQQRPESPKDYDPFVNVRRGGPKETRLYRTALMGEYDYRKVKDETELKPGRVIRDSLTLEMEDMPDFEPFQGVRRAGPKEVRLYKRALMGEYDYRKARDETVLEHVRRMKEDPFSFRQTSNMCRVSREDVDDLIWRQNKAAEPIVHPKTPKPNTASLPGVKNLVSTIAERAKKDDIGYKREVPVPSVSKYEPWIATPEPTGDREPYKYNPFTGVRYGGPKEKRLYATALMGEYDYRKPKEWSVMEITRMEVENQKRIKAEEEAAAKEAAWLASLEQEH